MPTSPNLHQYEKNENDKYYIYQPITANNDAGFILEGVYNVEVSFESLESLDTCKMLENTFIWCSVLMTRHIELVLQLVILVIQL